MPDDLTPAAASDAGDDAPALPPGDWLNVSQPNTPTAAPDWQAIAAQAVEALRLTREYVSPIIRLAAWPGWSWFDATNTYRRAAGIPTLEPEPVPELLAAGDAPTGYSPDYTSSDRGFKHLEPVPSTYAGRVRVYESSAADGPHLWLAITQPVDLNEPTGPELSTRAHLTAGSAEEVALQLLWLLEHHYQGASGSARATAAIRGLLAGDDSTAQPDAATTRFAGDLTQLALSEIARHLEQGDTLTPGGDWAPAAAMPPRHQVRRWLIARGVRRGRAQVAVYLRILMALNSAEVAGYTGGRQDRPTRHSSGPAAEAAAE